MRVGENDKVATITTAEHSDDENEVDTLPADDGEEDTTPEEEIISEKTE